MHADILLLFKSYYTEAKSKRPLHKCFGTPDMTKFNWAWNFNILWITCINCYQYLQQMLIEPPHGKTNKMACALILLVLSWGGSIICDET